MIVNKINWSIPIKNSSGKITNLSNSAGYYLPRILTKKAQHKRTGLFYRAGSFSAIMI